MGEVGRECTKPLQQDPHAQKIVLPVIALETGGGPGRTHGEDDTPPHTQKCTPVHTKHI